MAIAYLIITDYPKRAKRDGKQAIHIHFPESLSKMGWNIRCNTTEGLFVAKSGSNRYF